MKKYAVFALFTAVFVFFSCEYPRAFRYLPETDTSLFIGEDGVTVTFPPGTVARDIYNTVVHLFPDSNKWHDVTDGRWYRIRTVVVDGIPQQTLESMPFTRIKHNMTAERTNPNNTGLLYTHTVFLDGEATGKIIYQRQTFNVHQITERRNNPIAAYISFEAQR